LRTVKKWRRATAVGAVACVKEASDSRRTEAQIVRRTIELVICNHDFLDSFVS